MVSNAAIIAWLAVSGERWFLVLQDILWGWLYVVFIFGFHPKMNTTFTSHPRDSQRAWFFRESTQKLFDLGCGSRKTIAAIRFGGRYSYGSCSPRFSTSWIPEERWNSAGCSPLSNPASTTTAWVTVSPGFFQLCRSWAANNRLSPGFQLVDLILNPHTQAGRPGTAQTRGRCAAYCTSRCWHPDRRTA